MPWSDEDLINLLRASTTPDYGNGQVVTPWLDWQLEHDSGYDWLVEGWWPECAHLHCFAAQKSGKSLLTLWVAVCLALGRDPFTGLPREPVKVGYLDYEMTTSDVFSRIEAMGIDRRELTGLLFYWLYPSLPAMDTPKGGQELVKRLEAEGIQVVIIDTLSRVVDGPENDNDTYRRFFLYTGRLLKEAGIAMLRLDHSGHDETHSRGASAKGDDVDLVWQLKPTDGGMDLVRKAARLSDIPEKISLNKHEEPLSFQRVRDSWPMGTKEKAEELVNLGIPMELSRRKTAEALKNAGAEVGRWEVLDAARRYRRVWICK